MGYTTRDILAQEDLAGLLGPALAARREPGEGEYRAVGQAALDELAHRRGLELREVMIACLEQGIWPESLRKNRGSFTAAEQARLLGSAALVVGAGGLGGGVIQALARAGVGRLTVCDGDVFEESNLNRQVLARLDRLGVAKAACAAEEVALICPAAEVRVVEAWMDADNLPVLLEGVDLALDCLDGLPARYLLDGAARRAGVSYLHGAVGGLEGFVMTVAPGDPGLAGLYGPEPAAERGGGAEARLGVPTPTPQVVAGLQAAEALAALLGRPRLAGGRCLHLDLAVPSLEVLSLGRG
jgi:molybdopterin/thiamine biosynthesis adenylyltransferase